MAIYKIWLKVFITFFVECVNGEILQEPNNVGSLSSLNKSIVRLDTNIPVAEALGNYIEYTYKVILYLDYKLYETNNKKSFFHNIIKNVIKHCYDT